MKRVVLAAHVEQAHRRQRPRVDALRQQEPLSAVDRLGAWRGGTEQEQRAVIRGAAFGDRPGVVAGVAFVLVGALVFLVHHYQTDVRQGRKHGRAWAYADARFPALESGPLVMALAGSEPGVQNCHALAEAGPKPPHGLRRERDLGHEHDRRPPRSQGGLDRLKVDLGLARPGHAMEQKPAVTFAAPKGNEHALERLSLSRGQGRPCCRASIDRLYAPDLARAHPPARPRGEH